MPIPGVLLSTPDFRYPAKHFEIDRLGHKRRARTNAVPPVLWRSRGWR